MVRVSRLNRVCVAWWILVLSAGGVVWAQVPVTATSAPSAGASTDPASMPATNDKISSKDVSISVQRDRALDEAMAGKFPEALVKLKALAQADPQDSIIPKAIELLESYLQRKARVSVERQREYEYEVDRIRWANLAQKHVEMLEGKPYVKKLRTLIKTKLTEVYHDIGTAEGFEEAMATKAEVMKKTSLKKIDEASELIRQAIELLAKEKGAYVEEFRVEAKSLLESLSANRAVWASADPTTAKGRWDAARNLEKVENRLADTVTDMEVLVTEKPWKIALVHTQMAKKLAPDKDAMSKEAWYRALIADAEQRGRDAIRQAEWYDALSAYLALEELEPDNEHYEAEGKKVRRHVRVLRLYGQRKAEEELAAAQGESSEKSPRASEENEVEVEEIDDEPMWKEMVVGVDAEMVRQAIKRLGRSYVQAVDYRKLTRGALRSIKVLAQTPQVRDTFPGLKDQAKREAFIASLNKEISDIEKPDQIRKLDLVRAMNNILDRSEETVNIPVAVLVVEFADGFLNELDKFSSMIWPYNISDFNKSTMGRFIGVGIHIDKKPGEALRVVSPLLGAPAIEAGIKAGDLITKVDGKGTKKYTITRLTKMIMGPPNTTVVLTIKRGIVAKEFDVPVVRKRVNIRTVKGWQRREDGEWDYRLLDKPDIGYVRITQFTEMTHEKIKEALRQMRETGIRSLVLDLRTNPGGLLRSATKVADEFLAQGDIVSTRGRQVPRTYKRAHDNGLYLDGDLVVLVDEHSASAAEILSGALKDLKRAIIVGQRSYGKGSVQNLIPIRRDDVLLKLTTAYYYLPSNRLLHRKNGAKDWGVNPDVDIYITPRQMRRWLQIRRKTDLLQEFDPHLLRADLVRQYDADVQLDTAVLLLELLRLKQQEPAPAVQHVASDR